MKSLKKISSSPLFDLPEEEFVFSEQSVQGAKTAKRGNDVLILSPKRFKLFTEGVDYVKILVLNGEGHFKWSRGETKFLEGDEFEVNGVGEYELNGDGKYLIVRK